MTSRAIDYADNPARADPRISVRLRALMVDPDDRVEPVKITNIARLGFMADGVKPRETGDIVMLRIEQLGIHEARIVWWAGGKIGGRFTNPIDDVFLESF